MRTFLSDNASGIHPRVLKEIEKANLGHALAYGADPWTQRAEEKFKEVFGPNVFPFLFFNGTGTNVTAIASMLKSYQSVICTEYAHIYEDECGALEHVGGFKLHPLVARAGKISADQLARFDGLRGDMHKTQPGLLSITQTTERGTCYTLSELRGLKEATQFRNMKRHIDGARFANAVSSLQVDPIEIVSAFDVSALSFGGTKNGLMGAEALLVFDEVLANEIRYYRKQNLQLSSKMRFLSAQFLAYFDFWLETATHSNTMAKLLESQLKEIEEVELSEEVQSNGVFVKLPSAVISPLKEEFGFYIWNSRTGEVRLMCSFDTEPDDVYRFILRLKALLSR